MDEQGFEQTIMNKRYDSVIHMVTAAEGAEDFAGSAHSAQPAQETGETQALGWFITEIEVDFRLLDCWVLALYGFFV